ncbi:hypothetical protein GCM10022222_23080 [Amycolatopsis ultiminotia]|uniref:Methylmalonyl-CoA mutase, C-terminal domain n=1 Tax=Amycolatopsis ultiminotia TaxID=543629 RepID=A0ABP6VPY4_9PSEU
MSPRRVVLVELAENPDAVRLARLLRDDGFEVVHVGLLTTAEQILLTVEQEDPDALGVVGAQPPSGLADALGEVHLFVLGAGETPEEAAKALLGGRSHTLGTPSDRAR